MTHLAAGMLGALLGAAVGYGMAAYSLLHGGRSHRPLAGVGAPTTLTRFWRHNDLTDLDATDREWLQANAPFGVN